MKIKALTKYLLLRIPEKQNTKSPGGLILTEEAVDLNNDAIIESIGPDVPEGLKIGDHVFYNPYNAVFVSGAVLLVDYNCLLGIIEE